MGGVRETLEPRLVLLPGTASATEWSVDYTPVICTNSHRGLTGRIYTGGIPGAAVAAA